MHQYGQYSRQKIVFEGTESRRVCSTYWTAYTDACTTYRIKTVRTAVFLKMNPRVRNT